MNKPKITYFDIRARAEPIRLIFEELSVPYDDVRVTPEDWERIAAETPFGRLPSLTIDGREIFQTHAILRHLARTYDLYGSNESEHIRCDIAEEALADLNNMIGMAPWRPDFDSNRTLFIEKELSYALANLERFYLQRQSSSMLWVGDELTFIDMLAFAHLECTYTMFPEAFASAPNLTEFLKYLPLRPRIKAYLESDRRPKATQVGPKGMIYDNYYWDV